MITPVNKLILAPMEGVLDPLMRNLLCSINSFDFCIAEFIRVVDSLIPPAVFHRICPELVHTESTECKTPLRVQLLGQEPNWMAENAVRAIALGSYGIDLNFGCPANAVNKSRGGAILLKSPEKIYTIVNEVKQAVGSEVIVSAKIRLGWENTDILEEIVSAIQSAQANQLTIHARTKTDGYRPPAYWHFIGEISDKFDIELIANGDIWNEQNAIDCMASAKTQNLMLGRGNLALPNLANVIKINEQPMNWSQVALLLERYSQLELNGDKSFYFSSRLKQWLRYLKLQYPEAEMLFNQIKTLSDKKEILLLLALQAKLLR